MLIFEAKKLLRNSRILIIKSFDDAADHYLELWRLLKAPATPMRLTRLLNRMREESEGNYRVGALALCPNQPDLHEWTETPREFINLETGKIVKLFP